MIHLVCIRACIHSLIRVPRCAHTQTRGRACPRSIKVSTSSCGPSEDNKERKIVVDRCLQGGCKTDVRGIKRAREGMGKRGRASAAERAHITSSSKKEQKEKEEETAEDEEEEGVVVCQWRRWMSRGGTGGERREEAGSYACSAPPTLSETQDSTCPPSSRRTATHKSAGLVDGFAVPIPPFCILRCAARRVLDVNSPRVNASERMRLSENEIRNIENEIATTSKRPSERPESPFRDLIGSSSTRRRWARLYSWRKKCARSWCDYRY